MIGHCWAVTLCVDRPCIGLNRKPLTDDSAVPDYVVATEKLIAKIEKEHAGCLAAAEAAKAKAQQAGTCSRIDLLDSKRASPCAAAAFG